MLHVFHFENFSSPELIFVTHWAFFIVIFFQYFGTRAGGLRIWKILVQSEISPENFLKHSFQSDNHLIQENFNKAKLKNLCSMHPLIASGVMKMTTAVNIAGSGLSCTHFHIWYSIEMGKMEYLSNTFMSICIDGKPRVPKDKKLIYHLLFSNFVCIFQNVQNH